MQKIRDLSCSALMIFLLFGLRLAATGLDGTTNVAYIADHYIFRDGDDATGFVRLADGFSVVQEKNPATATTYPTGITLDMCVPMQGGFDLHETNSISLIGNLYLESNTTLTSGGVIEGNGNVLWLGGDLSLAAEKKLHIRSDLVIDAVGHVVALDNNAQLLLDAGVTLTIRNAIIKNKRSFPGLPSIQCSTTTCKLALDNVALALADDFYFSRGQLFVHNDVTISGTSSFVYSSPTMSFVDNHATLYFDHNITFSYCPATWGAYTGFAYDGSPLERIKLMDETATLFFNGANIKASHVGMNVTRGQVLLDNQVMIDTRSQDAVGVSFLGDSTGNHYETDDIRSLAWSPCGRYVAVGGLATGGDASVYMYYWDGSALIKVADAAFPTSFSITSLSWSCDGKYLAVVGFIDVSDAPVLIYHWDGSSLTPVAMSDVPYADDAYTVSWSPDGRFVAVGGLDSVAAPVFVYHWNGVNLIKVADSAADPYAGSMVKSLAWSSDGQYLAVGGFAGSATPAPVYMYRWDGQNLVKVAESTLNFTGGEINVLAWSPDGQYVAVGSMSNEINIFYWNGSTLALASDSSGDPYGSPYIYALAWSQDGRHIAIGGGSDAAAQLYVYDWDGELLTKNTALSDKLYAGTYIYSLSWSTDGRHIAVGGDLTPNAPVEIYGIDKTIISASPCTLTFGAAAYGPEYDVDVKVLGGARVVVNGALVSDDYNV